MEANTTNDAPNTTEENQAVEAEIVEQPEVENAGDPEPAVEDAEGNAGEPGAEAAADQVECTESEAVDEQANSGKDTETVTGETVGKEEQSEEKEGDGGAKEEGDTKENESTEAMDEGKKEESEKVEGSEKETEKINYTNLAPWFNEELHRLCKKNQQLYRRARENKNQTRIWDEFKDHQNSVHQEIRKVKREYQAKNELSDDDMAKLSTKSATKSREYGLLDFDVKVITDGRNLKEPENKGPHKRDHGNWVSPQEKRRRDQVMREYYKMYY